MLAKRFIQRLIETTGYTLERLPAGNPDVYDQDGLWTLHNHEFMKDPRFVRAHARGVQAAGQPITWPWRLHIGLWAASCAIELQGDFVECGVNRGVLSSAIMNYLDWNSRGRTFYLLDTFAGVEERLLTEAEKARGAAEANRAHLESGRYVRGVESVRRNFAEWKNVRIVEGVIPDTLREVDAQKIAYLHLDLNSTRPEVEALSYFWERLVPGALVLLDDYAFDGYRESKLGMDAFARERRVEIASLPTGQGLLLKPSR